MPEPMVIVVARGTEAVQKLIEATQDHWDVLEFYEPVKPCQEDNHGGDNPTQAHPV